jgi:WG containing repeat
MRKTILFIALFLLAAGENLNSQQLVPFLKGKEWKVYDKVQRSFLKENYQNVIPSKCNLLFVQQNEKWGVMDKNRKLVLPIEYLSAQQINMSVISVKDKSGITLCDTTGKAISKEHFTEASPYKKNEDWIVVRTEKSSSASLIPKASICFLRNMILHLNTLLTVL